MSRPPRPCSAASMVHIAPAHMNGAPPFMPMSLSAASALPPRPAQGRPPHHQNNAAIPDLTQHAMTLRSSTLYQPQPAYQPPSSAALPTASFNLNNSNVALLLPQPSPMRNARSRCGSASVSSTSSSPGRGEHSYHELQDMQTGDEASDLGVEGEEVDDKPKAKKAKGLTRKRTDWSKGEAAERMRAAVEECTQMSKMEENGESGKTSFRSVARKYNISWAVLYPRLAGKIGINASLGSRSKLPPNLEDRIYKHVDDMARNGGGMDWKEIKCLAKKLAEECGITGFEGTDGWVRQFQNRFPQLQRLRVEVIGDGQNEDEEKSARRRPRHKYVVVARSDGGQLGLMTPESPSHSLMASRHESPSHSLTSASAASSPVPSLSGNNCSSLAFALHAMHPPPPDCESASPPRGGQAASQGVITRSMANGTFARRPPSCTAASASSSLTQQQQPSASAVSQSMCHAPTSPSPVSTTTAPSASPPSIVSTLPHNPMALHPHPIHASTVLSIPASSTGSMAPPIISTSGPAASTITATAPPVPPPAKTMERDGAARCGTTQQSRARVRARTNDHAVKQEDMKRIDQLLKDEAQFAERMLKGQCTRTSSTRAMHQGIGWGNVGEGIIGKKRERSVDEGLAVELLRSQGFVKEDGKLSVSSAKAFVDRFGFKVPRGRRAKREDYVQLLLDIANAAPQGGWSADGLKQYANNLATLSGGGVLNPETHAAGPFPGFEGFQPTHSVGGGPSSAFMRLQHQPALMPLGDGGGMLYGVGGEPDLHVPAHHSQGNHGFPFFTEAPPYMDLLQQPHGHSFAQASPMMGVAQGLQQLGGWDDGDATG